MSLFFEGCKKVYTGNGLTREWSYDFPLPDASYMKVYISPPGGVAELVSVGYRVDVQAQRVVYPASDDAEALPVGWTLVLIRKLPLTQPIGLLSQQGRFFARDAERGLDTQEMQIQQLAEEVSRAIKAPVDDQYDTDELVAQVIDTHERYNEITQKHGETLSARDAAAAAKGAAESSEVLALAAKDLAQEAALTASAAKEVVLAASAVLPWNAAETYNYPDMACCPDGHTYRCIGTNNLNDYPPESSLWVRITVIQTAGTYDMESGGTFGDAAASAISGGTF